MARHSILVAIVVALTLGSSGRVAGQDAPQASFLVGFGNAFGWIGGQVAGYVAQGRISGFAGLGVMPNLLNDEGDGVAGAVGIRAFTGGSRHRGMLEISLSALSTTASSTWGSEVVEDSRSYGPGMAVGYQFIQDDGFTFMLSGGIGYDDEGADPDQSQLRPMVGIGVGYSVR